MYHYDFTVNKDKNNIIEALIKYGVCHIPKFIQNELLDDVKSIFFECFKKNHPIVSYRHGKHATNPGNQLIINTDIAKLNGIEVFEKILFSELMYDIASDFFGKNKFILNNVVRFTHLLPSPKPILPWHFDRSQTLKLWIYVKDANINDGALEYCPGSHWEGKYRAGYHTLSGTRLLDIPNDIPEYRIQNPVTLEGKAGDLFIFDPDGFHRGGIIQPGHERCVIRADSQPIPDWNKKSSILNLRRFLATPFNIAKHLKKYGSRTHGPKFSDRAISRNKNKELKNVK